MNIKGQEFTREELRNIIAGSGTTYSGFSVCFSQQKEDLDIKTLDSNQRTLNILNYRRNLECISKYILFLVNPFIYFHMSSC
jgi:hypothetical protein